MADDDDFITQEYHSYLANVATQRNSILYLPTWSGKTYIAILVIKQFIHELERSLKDGGKIVVIIVNKVPLIEQTAQVMARHLPVNEVGWYCGATNVDNMAEDYWHHELNAHKVAVMTSQVLLDVLRTNKLRVDQLAVVVLDDCHLAVGEDPMSELMELIRTSPAHSKPRILGMSATLLNRDVPLDEVNLHISKLEANLDAKVVTCCKENVARYATKAVMRFETFEANAKTNDTLKALSLLQEIDFRGTYEVMAGAHLSAEEFYHPIFVVDRYMKFPSLKSDIEKIIEDMGVYAGIKTALNCICLLEKTAIRTEEEKSLFALRRLICDLIGLRQILSEEIFQGDGDFIFNTSSSKLQTLVKILKKHNDRCPTDSDSSESSKFCAIVFVAEKLTAKILWAVLEGLSRKSEYDFIRPGFIVGPSKDPPESRSSLLSIEWNSDVLRRFSVGAVNVLISSTVLEEGMDVPDCDVVICYDELKSYLSYNQAQEWVKHEKSTFVVMAPGDSPQGVELQEKMRCWEEQRNRIHKYVYRNTAIPRDSSPLAECDTMEPYKTPSGAVLTVNSAISTLNRYCMSLTNRQYFNVTPLWREIPQTDDAEKKTKFEVELKMPIPCPLRKPVRGAMSDTVKGAKRLAAFELCKQLHSIDELNDSLYPRKDSSLLHLPSLFPFWDPEQAQVPTSTHSMYLEAYPDCMNNCLPKEGEVYIHLLQIVPTSTRPQMGDNRKTVYYDMLASDFQYAIVSSKEMLKVCDFPVFAPGVDLKVHLVPSASKVTLSCEEIEALFAFHSNLFLGPVPVVRSYMTFNRNCDKFDFALAPVKSVDGNIEILWDVVRKNKTFREGRSLDDTQRKNLKIDIKEYELAIVKPWYRCLLPYEVYLVAEVCHDMDATSAFPTIDYDTFFDYFDQKYNLQLFHMTQPLLEVRHLYTKVVALTPRVQTKKKRWDKDSDECREHMMPELCTLLKFPSALWIKGTFLPSAIHRLRRLLTAEELRRRIVREADVGYKNDDMALNDLVVDPSTLEVKEKKDYTFISTKHGVGKGSIKLTERRQAVQSRKPWGNEQEPVDIARAMETLNIMEVAYYEQFISKNDGAGASPRKKKRPVFSLPEIEPGEGKIQLLSFSDGDYGPQINEVFRAITSKSANEIAHQEELTILGQAVLRLTVSLYLYFSFANLPAGNLQWVASNLTSDHNLAFCGLNKKVQHIAKVQEYACDYCRPPLFQVPPFLEKAVIDNKVESAILNAVEFDPEEQRSGNIRQESNNYILDLMQELKSQGKSFGDYAPRILDHQSICSRDVADVVSALIGLYFKTNGLEGAMKIIAWFRLLPKDCVSLILQDIQLGDHKNYGNVNRHLKCTTDLEKRMRYSFRNPSYLLDALTHDSYIEADNEGQDRLSCVGYAILDFLLAAYVWEKLGNRDLDERQDLIAALTNRLTFAGLLVRHNLHKYILLVSSKLIDVIDLFVKYQDEREHIIDEETFVQMTDAEIEDDEKPVVPCVLAHTFAALVGAVYLDTFCDMNETWLFVYRFFKQEIESFSKNPPRQPKELLKDLTPTPSFARFETERDVKTGRYNTVCQIHTNGMRKDVQAIGETEASAENTAAKKAINYLLFTPDQ